MATQFFAHWHRQILVMEIAGVVLGAVPVIIYALESYGRATEILNDTHKWLDMIQEIQDVIEVQVEMLRVTLQSLGIEWTHQSDMSITDIETALKERKPLKWDRFLRIIQRMDAMVTEMAKDLCPDAKGPVGISTYPEYSKTKLIRRCMIVYLAYNHAAELDIYRSVTHAVGVA